MDLDYVVTEEGSNAIDELKTFLYEDVWLQGEIPPLVRFRYESASAIKAIQKRAWVNAASIGLVWHPSKLAYSWLENCFSSWSETKGVMSI